jgi:hypothetical protein
MKKAIIVYSILLISAYIYGQENTMYQKGMTAEQNLNAIGKLMPYSTGGVGFDTRYEGVKGSPFLFEKLQQSIVKVTGQESFIRFESNLDIAGRKLIFKHPGTGKLMSLPSDMILEYRVNVNGKEEIYRVSSKEQEEKDLRGDRFYQVLNDGQYKFIKVPFKKLIEADYKAAYSPDRRYDEYTTYYKYYLSGSDSLFHQIQLTERSLKKLFPAKSKEIDEAFRNEKEIGEESVVLSILQKM